MDSGDKASNKAMAIALKYAFFQVFCIPTEEMKDPDAETPEASSPKKQTPAIPAEQPKQEQPCTCEACGKQIRDAKNSAGEVWKAKDIAVYTKLRYNRKLCVGCMSKEPDPNA